MVIGLSAFFILVFTVIICMILLMGRINKRMELQSNLLVSYTQTIEKLYEDVRMHKHDLANIMLSMKQYAELGDGERLNNLYNTEILNLEDLHGDMFSELKEFDKIQDPLIRGLLLSKKELGKTKGVEIRYCIDTTELSIKKEWKNIIKLDKFLNVMIRSAKKSGDNAVVCMIESNNGNIVAKIDQKGV